MGDGVLFIERNYHPSYSVRLERMRLLTPLRESWWAGMQAAYADALRFKFHPSHDLPAGKSLQAWYNEILSLFLDVFLWFERQRLENSNLDWAGYQSLPSRLPILSRAGLLKNFYRNMRRQNSVRIPGPEFFLHPRDRILKRLPGLLLQDAATPDDEELVLRLWESFG